MFSRLIAMALATFLACWCLPALAGSKEGIVVWRLVAKEGVTEKNIDSISGFLAGEVARHSGMKVFSEEDLKSIIEGEEKKQLCGGDDTVCVAEIGAALGVPEAVSGDLGRVGSYWMLNLRRINVKRAEVISRSTRQIKGSVDDLIEAIPGAVAELFGKTIEAPAPVVAPAPEPKPEPEPEKKGMSPYEIGAYASFFGGVGLVAIGGIGTWRMTESWSDYEASRGADKDAESGFRTWKATSIACYAVGGAAIATGAALWIIDPYLNEPHPGEPEISFGASPAPDGFSTSIMGRW